MVEEVVLYPQNRARGKKRPARAAFKRKTYPTAPKSGKRRIKPRGISKLKKELDSIYSKYIRTKYAINGTCYCYTCNKPMEIKKAQCGHFIPRTYLATRWDESNTRPQCVGCNIWGRGQLLDFEDNLVEEIGREAVDILKRKRLLIWKLNAHWYEAEIARYKDLLENLPT